MNWISKATLALIIVSVIWVFVIWWAISFNNRMISMTQRIDNELESTKTNYSQCIIKIWETNQIAKAYSKDVTNLADKAWENLSWFSEQMMTWFNTNVIPDLSPNLRENVQREIISCRNAYIAKVDLDLKPLFTTYNTSIQSFPNVLFNMLLWYDKKEFKMPQEAKVTESFETWVDKQLDLD